jgi:ABC-type sugar transport system ATPase subunit
MNGAPNPVVRARAIVKSFGATRAVRGVSLDIPEGSIVGLVGENGAGKSTLARVIAGVFAPDDGVLEIAGQVRHLRDPHDGLKAGVSLMAQEIALVPDATVEANVLLGSLPRRGPFLDRTEMRRRYLELAALTQFDIDPAARVSRLRVADQQKVEIMRAMSQDARLVVMDEPSAALTADEVERLHHSIREMRRRGTAVLIVSHFLEEVLELTSRVAIMRDGELVREGPTSDETVETLVAAMVGRALAVDYHEKREQATGPVCLSVRGLTRPGVLKDVSFDVRRGEILGLAGLIGAGRSEIARCIYGADERGAGDVTVDGAAANASHPAEAIAKGIFMVPESRQEQGLVPESSISDNLTLSTLRRYSRGGWLDRRAVDARASELAGEVDLRFQTVSQQVGSLSGGNQQKILFGRAREVGPKVLIVDEPTRGVDIAAKRAIHAKLVELAAEGMAILFISSEIEEILGVCSRVLVIHRGQVHAEFRAPYRQEDVIAAFFGQRVSSI